MAVAPPPAVPSGVLERIQSDLRSQRAARGKWPPGELSFSLRPHARVRARAAPAAAADARDVRPGVHAAAAVPAGRVRARPGGEPLHHRLARVELPLARRLDGRPDPAARRRPADHRRRLPPARAPDHAAGVPPRAARRVDCGSWSRRPSGRPGRLAPGHAARPVRVDAQARAARGDAGAVRLRPGPRRARRAHGRGVRGGARPTGARTTCCRCCAARARPGAR